MMEGLKKTIKYFREELEQDRKGSQMEIPDEIDIAHHYYDY